MTEVINDIVRPSVLVLPILPPGEQPTISGALFLSGGLVYVWNSLSGAHLVNSEQ